MLVWWQWWPWFWMISWWIGWLTDWGCQTCFEYTACMWVWVRCEAFQTSLWSLVGCLPLAVHNAADCSAACISFYVYVYTLGSVPACLSKHHRKQALVPLFSCSAVTIVIEGLGEFLKNLKYNVCHAITWCVFKGTLKAHTYSLGGCVWGEPTH